MWKTVCAVSFHYILKVTVHLKYQVKFWIILKHMTDHHVYTAHMELLLMANHFVSFTTIHAGQTAGRSGVPIWLYITHDSAL